MTPQQIDAMKLVLEFVESINLGSRSASVEQQRQVITAIKEALAQPEQNFCPRCGKRTQDIHTCTPPQEKNT